MFSAKIDHSQQEYPSAIPMDPVSITQEGFFYPSNDELEKE
jgi:hypothetical protein